MVSTNWSGESAVPTYSEMMANVHRAFPKVLMGGTAFEMMAVKRSTTVSPSVGTRALDTEILGRKSSSHEQWVAMVWAVAHSRDQSATKTA
jgi:hypothetical protein